MESWISQAKDVPSLEAEVCFLLKNEYYYGPDRIPELSERKQVERLALPNFPRKVEKLARSSEIIGYEASLAAYYKQIIVLAQKHKKPFNQYRSYFWLRLWLWNSDSQVQASFPWYDSLSEMEYFIDNLTSTESGQVYYDVDQGWAFEVWAMDGFFYVREYDPDSDEAPDVIRTPRDLLITRLEEARARARRIIERLSKELGADVWTTWVESPRFSFQGFVEQKGNPVE
jgi:hypothetical protein